ncbi:MAG: hydrolase 2, exosortase A system-associated [Pseudomonadota bacterium]
MPDSPRMATNDPIDISPFFLEGAHASLFCLRLAPRSRPPRGGILYVPPFAEEMHKSRRMAALQARALAACGYEVLQIDPTGCGDSGGDFRDASWSVWRDDVRVAYARLAESTGGAVSLWGLRTGAVLAAEVSQSLAGVQSVVLWQPVASGDLFLNQFLRIKLASEMLTGGQAQSGTKQLRAQLEQGQAVEVGGYMLSPAMAMELAALRLTDMTPGCPTYWLEVGAQAGEHVTPASQRVIDAWRGRGVPVAGRTVRGDPFWVTQEISECPELLVWPGCPDMPGGELAMAPCLAADSMGVAA